MQLEIMKLELTGKEVYLKTFQICKENFKVVYGLSFLLFLLNMVNLLMATVRANIDNTSVLLLINLLAIVVTIFSVFWSLRFNISLIFSFKEMFNGRKLNLRETIKSSEGYVLDYVIGGMMLMLVNIVPIMMLGKFSIQVEGHVGKVLVIVSAIIMYVLINTTFGYLPYIKILEVKILKPYRYAKEIANKKFKIAMLVLNFRLITILYGVIRDNLQGKQNSIGVVEFFLSSVPHLLELIFLPLIVGGITITYILLTKKRVLQ